MFWEISRDEWSQKPMVTATWLNYEVMSNSRFMVSHVSVCGTQSTILNEIRILVFVAILLRIKCRSHLPFNVPLIEKQVLIFYVVFVLCSYQSVLCRIYFNFLKYFQNFNLKKNELIFEFDLYSFSVLR